LKGIILLSSSGNCIHFILNLYKLFELGLPGILLIEQLTAINENLGVPSDDPLCLIKITSRIIKKIIGNTVDFNFYLLGNKFVYLQYYNYPDISKLSIKRWIDKAQIPKEEFKNYLINEKFYLLTDYESEILYNYFSEQHERYRSKSHLLKDLIIRSLKLIGCPAHYSDITEKVREIGKEKYKNCSYNFVHGALNRYKEFVWVGQKGIYGLKEWGLSPPDKPLEDQIYSILKNSEKPLSKESIATELSKQRPYFTKTSLNLILSTSDKIIKTSDNFYRAVNEEDIKGEKFKRAQMDKMSNAMEEVFKEWQKQKNSK